MVEAPDCLIADVGSAWLCELESAKSGLEWMKTEWAEATAASNSGRITAAAEKARAVKAKGLEVEKTLGMKETRELTASKE